MDDEDIRAGRSTDFYFLRTKQILETKNIRKHALAEVRTKQLPKDWKWGVFAGIEEVIGLLEGFPIDLFGLPEGTLFEVGTPVLMVDGNYLDYGIYETPILGLVCQASGIATQAARFRKLAGEKISITVGARRMHPAITPMIDRSAYIGGVNGVAAIAGAELLSLKPNESMPHALTLLVGDAVEAALLFHEVVPRKVPRVALVDTFNDEKFEAIRVAQSLGKNLDAIRVDTPDSRRGSILEICREIRWELDLRGFEHVRIIVSGSVNEDQITELRSVVDGFGVGTHVANAPSINFAFDLVEIEGQPLSKKGKWSGRKDVRRCTKCFKTLVIPTQKRATRCSDCGGKTRSLIVQYLKKGKRVRTLSSPKAIRTAVIEQLRSIPIL